MIWSVALVEVMSRLFGPEPFAGDAGALDQRRELPPHDRGVNFIRARKGRKAAVGAGNDALAADDVGEPAEALRDQFGMLDQDRRLRDDARKQHFVVRQFRRFHTSISCSCRGFAASNV